jgi:hypothetical protein
LIVSPQLESIEEHQLPMIILCSVEDLDDQAPGFLKLSVCPPAHPGERILLLVRQAA